MEPMSPDALLAQLRWRYAVKTFDAARKIPAELWSQLEDALVLSPSSYGLQPWKFFVVENLALREKLLPASWGQRQIVDASHLVVFAVKKNVGPDDAARWVKRVAEVRGVPVETLETYRGMMAGSLSRATPPEVDAWMSRQVFIAHGVFLTACAVLGVDACPMEGFEPAKYDEILGLAAKGYGSVVLATAGYRAADDANAPAPKARYPKVEIVERI